ncbi:MAG: crotonase/enoyl-CoA hydratase family protein [Archaeoglobaceae archaeon]|nr:crotonase/enoyl-CoA hydratase family protein [Archaeoglobaceae archaeon]MDW8118764.1 crotonase/enoyl-CoA hydratase family protein [Archaeoglobaceae archaeon]
MSLILTEKRSHILVVTINRAEKRNAINLEMAEELEKVWNNFEKDDNLYVGIITGAGDNFCAGADLGDLERLATRVGSKNGPLGFTRMTLSKPVIASISGYCVAGGFEIALWADIRIADESAKFGILNRRFGVPLIDGGTQRLPKIVGLGNALDLILTGKLIDAKEAHRIGLVNEIVPKGLALKRALEIAELISSHPQVPMRNDRKAVFEGFGLSLEDALEIEAKLGYESIRNGTDFLKVRRFIAEGKGKHGERLQ